MHDLNLRELLVGQPTRLRYVVRFSTCHKVHQETVAEHMYYTALYSMLIAAWCNDNELVGRELDMEILLSNCLIHDLEEAITGDINRIFKHSDEVLKKKIDECGHQAIHDIVSAIAGGGVAYIVSRKWSHAKDKTINGRILAFADFLSVLSYMLQELTNANITMGEHWKTMHSYIKEFDDFSYDFLRPLICQANKLLVDGFLGKTIDIGDCEDATKV